MKRDLDFYEFVAIVIPGALVLLFAAWAFQGLRSELISDKFGLGDLGILLLLAYPCGHLVQAVSNVWETAFWKVQGGMPTEWIRLEDQRLLSKSQVDRLEIQLASQLHIRMPASLQKIAAGDWQSITRQVYAAVAAAGGCSRVDLFNGNYGLLRGMISAFFVMGIMTVTAPVHPVIKIEGWLIVLAILSGFRMHRFGRYYARELFVQFLQLPTSCEKTAPTAPVTQDTLAP